MVLWSFSLSLSLSLNVNQPCNVIFLTGVSGASARIYIWPLVGSFYFPVFVMGIFTVSTKEKLWWLFVWPPLILYPKSWMEVFFLTYNVRTSHWNFIFWFFADFVFKIRLILLDFLFKKQSKTYPRIRDCALPISSLVPFILAYRSTNLSHTWRESFSHQMFKCHHRPSVLWRKQLSCRRRMVYSAVLWHA